MKPLFAATALALTISPQAVRGQTTSIATSQVTTALEHCILVSDQWGGCFVEEITNQDVSIFAEEHIVQMLSAMNILNQIGNMDIYLLSAEAYHEKGRGADGGFHYDVRDVDPESQDLDITAWGSAARDATHRQGTAEDTFRILLPTDPLTSRCVMAVLSGIGAGGLGGFAATYSTGNPYVIGTVTAGAAVVGGFGAYSGNDACWDDCDEETESEKTDTTDECADTSEEDDDVDVEVDADESDIDTGEKDEDYSDVEVGEMTITPDPLGNDIPPGEIDTSPFGPYGPDIDTGEITPLNIEEIMTPVEEGGCGLGAVTFYRFPTTSLVNRNLGATRDTLLDPWILTDDVSLDLDILDVGCTTERPTEESLVQPPDIWGF